MQQIPNITQDDINKCCTVLILAMLSTNAHTMRVKQEKFHDSEGNVLGTFKITVEKIEE